MQEGLSTKLLILSPTSVIQDLYTHVQEVGDIHNTIDISTFINPGDKAICNTEDTRADDGVLDNIVAQFVQLPEDLEEGDNKEEQQILPIPTTEAALQAIQILQHYTEGLGGGIKEPASYIQVLNKIDDALLIH